MIWPLMNTHNQPRHCWIWSGFVTVDDGIGIRLQPLRTWNFSRHLAVDVLIDLTRSTPVLGYILSVKFRRLFHFTSLLASQFSQSWDCLCPFITQTAVTPTAINPNGTSACVSTLDYLFPIPAVALILLKTRPPSPAPPSILIPRFNPKCSTHHVASLLNQLKLIFSENSLNLSI